MARFFNIYFSSDIVLLSFSHFEFKFKSISNIIIFLYIISTLISTLFYALILTEYFSYILIPILTLYLFYLIFWFHF